MHVLQGCPERFRKILKEDEYYFFNDWYRLEKGKLVRNEGNVNTRNFFGDNISIQAIVGKNGCGKSSLFELIYRILNNFSYVAVGDSYRATAMPLYFIRDIRAELYYELEDTLCCITCKDDEVFIKRGEQESLNLHFPYSNNYQIERYLDEVDPFRNEKTEANNSKIQKKIVEETLTSFFYSLAINYSIQSLNPCDYESERSFGDGEDDECYDSWLMSLYNKNDGYMVPLGFEPYRGGNTINLRNQKELTEDRLSALLIDSRNKNMTLPLYSSERFSVIPNYELDTITFVPDYALLYRKTYDDDDITEHLLDFIDDPSDSRLQLFWSAFDLQYCGDEIENGDLYNPVLEIYLWEYNNSGAIAYANLTQNEAISIAKEMAEDNEYWGANLGGKSYIVEAEDANKYKDESPELFEANEKAILEYLDQLLKENYKEKIQVKTQTGYAAAVTDSAAPYSKELITDSVFASWFSLHTLWDKIRTTGGAYGASAYVANDDGKFIMVTYRDPSPEKSVSVFKESLQEMKDKVIPEEDIERTIVSAYGDELIPLTPRDRGGKAFAGLIYATPHEVNKKRVETMFSITSEDVSNSMKRLADNTQKFWNGVVFCDKSKDKYGKILKLPL